MYRWTFCFLSHCSLLEKALFFILQSLCGLSWTEQWKCLCWVTAFTLRLTWLSGRFRWSHWCKHPVEPGQGSASCCWYQVNCLLPNVTRGPCDLVLSCSVADGGRTIILVLSAEQIVLLKNWELVSTYFANKVNAVTTPPQFMRFVHWEQCPIQPGYRILEDDKGPGGVSS